MSWRANDSPSRRPCCRCRWLRGSSGGPGRRDARALTDALDLADGFALGQVVEALEHGAGGVVVDHRRLPPHLAVGRRDGEAEEGAARPLPGGEIAHPRLDALPGAEP